MRAQHHDLVNQTYRNLGAGLELFLTAVTVSEQNIWSKFVDDQLTELSEIEGILKTREEFLAEWYEAEFVTRVDGVFDAE